MAATVSKSVSVAVTTRERVPASAIQELCYVHHGLEAVVQQIRPAERRRDPEAEVANDPQAPHEPRPRLTAAPRFALQVLGRGRLLHLRGDAESVLRSDYGGSHHHWPRDDRPELPHLRRRNDR